MTGRWECREDELGHYVTFYDATGAPVRFTEANAHIVALVERYDEAVRLARRWFDAEDEHESAVVLGELVGLLTEEP